jgi:GNAT superfamily N-acetyltransferase
MRTAQLGPEQRRVSLARMARACCMSVGGAGSTARREPLERRVRSPVMEPLASSYAVRKASAGDLLAVVRLYERTPDLAADRLSSRQRAMWNRMMATKDLTVYLAETHQQAVGTATLLVMPHVTYDCRPTAFIEAMVVAQAHRRRGVGRMLLGRLLDDARATACRKVQLLSHKRHGGDGAHDFYRSLGFTAEAEGFRLYLDT